MASAQFSRRVGKVLGYPPLSEMSDLQRREFQEALFDDSVGVEVALYADVDLG
jgi:hypothetical protein